MLSNSSSSISSVNSLLLPCSSGIRNNEPSHIPNEIWAAIFKRIRSSIDRGAFMLACRNFRNLGCNLTQHLALDTFTRQIKLRFAELKYLDLSKSTSNRFPFPVDFSAISELAKLRFLDISNCATLNDAHLRGFETLTNLATLKVSGCANISARGIKSLEKLNRLEFFVCPFSGVSHDEGLHAIESLRYLKTLVVGGGEITNRGLGSLAKMTQLVAIGLIKCNEISSTGLRQLTSLGQLQLITTMLCPRAELGQVRWLRVNHLVEHMNATQISAQCNLGHYDDPREAHTHALQRNSKSYFTGDSPDVLNQNYTTINASHPLANVIRENIEAIRSGTLLNNENGLQSYNWKQKSWGQKVVARFSQIELQNRFEHSLYLQMHAELIDVLCANDRQFIASLPPTYPLLPTNEQFRRSEKNLFARTFDKIGVYFRNVLSAISACIKTLSRLILALVVRIRQSLSFSSEMNA